MSNGHGGPRPGSGRPKGALNKRSSAVRERLEELGADPIKVLYDLMESGGDDGDDKLRLDAAKALMPYAYPRLASQDLNLSGEIGTPELRVIVEKNGKANDGPGSPS